MEKKVETFFDVTVPMVDLEFTVLFLGREKLKKYLEKHHKECLDEMPNREIYGQCFFTKDNFVYMWMERKPKTAQEHGTLGHEIQHLVIETMRRLSTPLCSETEEMYCKMTGEITRQIYAKL